MVRTCVPWAVTCAVFTGAVGCVSLSTATPGRTADKGTVQVVVAPSVSRQPIEQVLTGSTRQVVAPQLLVAGRYSVTDRFTLGGRLQATGVHLDTHFGLLRAPADRFGINLSVAPALGAGLHGLQATVPVIAGFTAATGFELFLGPRAAVVQPLDFEDPLNVYGGASLGCAVPVNDRVRLLFEVVGAGQVRDHGNRAFTGENALIFEGTAGIAIGNFDVERSKDGAAR